jgi:hypothetical protein
VNLDLQGGPIAVDVGSSPIERSLRAIKPFAGSDQDLATSVESLLLS